MIKKTILILLLAIPPCAFGDEARPGDAQILTWLKELKPLPKVHYSWPLPFERLSDELLQEYVRLTNAVSLSVEWSTAEQIERAVAICKRVNAGKPEIPASIGINCSVWHRRFGKDLPPTDTGPTHQAELDYLTMRLATVRDALSAANQKHETDAKVSAILFDSERFCVRPDDSRWNDAITAKYDMATAIVRKIFPKVRIEWYARGEIAPSASITGWSESPYFALGEKGESFSCSLYAVPAVHDNFVQMFKETPGAQLQLIDPHYRVAGDYVIGNGLWKMTIPKSPDMLGRYTDVVKMKDGKWVIVLDHPSVPAPEKPASQLNK